MLKELYKYLRKLFSGTGGTVLNVVTAALILPVSPAALVLAVLFFIWYMDGEDED